MGEIRPPDEVIVNPDKHRKSLKERLVEYP